MPNYRRLLILPEKSDGLDITFTNPIGTVVAYGYLRVVLGGRGPYVEMADRHIEKGNLHVPEKAAWRLDNRRAYYHEYRTDDAAYTKVYRQLIPVDYADYIPGMWYVSPFDLTSDKYPKLIQTNKKTQLRLFGS
jgi:hypothetical protein